MVDLTTPLTPEFTTQLFNELTELRRHFHQNPDGCWNEFNTQAKVKEYLIEHAHISPEDIHECATTGLIVNISGPQNDEAALEDVKCIAFRGDMDALPMTEDNPHLPYQSINPGVAHMCGHDGHTTSLIGFGILMQRSRHLLPPNTCVRLLFQPAEEGGFGAVKMIEDGCLKGVDEIYGYHNDSDPFGSIVVKSGPFMAHSCRFYITINGPGGHGSAPHFTSDPIIAAAQMIMSMQSIVSRNISAQENAILSITQVHGGEADNVIPSQVRLSGTLRDFNPSVALLVHTRMKQIVENTAAAFNVTANIEFKDGYPVTFNHPFQTSTIEEIAACVVGKDHIITKGLPAQASEDFSYYLQQVPGTYYFIGTQEAGESQRRDCHRNTYDFNDKVLPLTVRMFLEIVQRRLECILYSSDEMTMIYPSQA
ncbi:amidohydrolase family protein [Thraustotheca clavata]|uniref:Amidohydrolase family protein n=1 Tax=Thraustotheca clavata TaxID=74557 RepID=A0A1W0A7I2_9STRA|nr:amidohydrolase family protein [Thraustotheca clavata]